MRDNWHRDKISSWREKLVEACNESGDRFDDLEMTLTDEQLDQKFDAGYGVPDGCGFTAWSDKYVYFPACYDGSEWVDWVPRNPCNIITNHVGGPD
jgi:hypothetical protein